jgi:hypothetical protein
MHNSGGVLSKRYALVTGHRFGAAPYACWLSAGPRSAWIAKDLAVDGNYSEGARRFRPNWIHADFSASLLNLSRSVRTIPRNR